MLAQDVHVPEVRIDPAVLPFSSTSRILKVHMTAKDSTEELESLNVYVNGVPIYGAAGMELRNKHTKYWEHDLQVELGEGTNQIEISALNVRGAESLRRRGQTVYTGPAEGRRDLYVLAIGVSEYADQRYNLNFAAKDAADMIGFWKRNETRFGQVHCLRLLDKDATKEKILGARSFLAKAKVDDEVILFFAGHGLLDDRLDYYFAAHNINFDRPSERGLSYNDIESLLDGVLARKRLLLIDSCHAGEVDKQDTTAVSADPTGGNKGGLGPGVRIVRPRARPGKSYVGLSNSFSLTQSLFADLRRGSGAEVIAASGGQEYAYEAGGWNNGLFTAMVLEGLKGKAKTDRDGRIRVSELRDYVVKRVRELTGGRQQPTTRAENLESNFFLW